MSLALPPALFLLGPTAAGKDASAACLARALIARGTPVDLVAMDAIKVYSGLDVLTDAPSAADREGLVWHQLGHVPPSTGTSTGRYRDEVMALLPRLAAAGIRPLFVGGTALYYKALTAGLAEGIASDPSVRARLEDAYDRDPDGEHARLKQVDPRTAARVHRNDRQRIVRALEVHAVTGRAQGEIAASWRGEGTQREIAVPERRTLGIMPPWAELRARIAARAARVFAEGRDAAAVVEVARVRAAGPLAETVAKGVGVAEAMALIDGEIDAAEAIDRVTRRTLRLAKAQRTWFRSLDDVEWLEVAATAQPPEMAALLLERLAQPSRPERPSF